MRGGAVGRLRAQLLDRRPDLEADPPGDAPIGPAGGAGRLDKADDDVVLAVPAADPKVGEARAVPAEGGGIVQAHGLGRYIADELVGVLRAPPPEYARRGRGVGHRHDDAETAVQGAHARIVAGHRRPGGTRLHEPPDELVVEGRAVLDEGELGRRGRAGQQVGPLELAHAHLPVLARARVAHVVGDPHHDPRRGRRAAQVGLDVELWRAVGPRIRGDVEAAGPRDERWGVAGRPAQALEREREVPLVEGRGVEAHPAHGAGADGGPQVGVGPDGARAEEDAADRAERRHFALAVAVREEGRRPQGPRRGIPRGHDRAVGERVDARPHRAARARVERRADALEVREAVDGVRVERALHLLDDQVLAPLVDVALELGRGAAVRPGADEHPDLDVPLAGREVGVRALPHDAAEHLDQGRVVCREARDELVAHPAEVEPLPHDLAADDHPVLVALQVCRSVEARDAAQHHGPVDVAVRDDEPRRGVGVGAPFVPRGGAGRRLVVGPRDTADGADRCIRWRRQLVGETVHAQRLLQEEDARHADAVVVDHHLAGPGADGGEGRLDDPRELRAVERQPPGPQERAGHHVGARRDARLGPALDDHARRRAPPRLGLAQQRRRLAGPVQAIGGLAVGLAAALRRGVGRELGVGEGHVVERVGVGREAGPRRASGGRVRAGPPRRARALLERERALVVGRHRAGCQPQVGDARDLLADELAAGVGADVGVEQEGDAAGGEVGDLLQGPLAQQRDDDGRHLVGGGPGGGRGRGAREEVGPPEGGPPGERRAGDEEVEQVDDLGGAPGHGRRRHVDGAGGVGPEGVEGVLDGDPVVVGLEDVVDVVDLVRDEEAAPQLAEQVLVDDHVAAPDRLREPLAEPPLGAAIQRLDVETAL